MLLGAHVSVAGGYINGLLEANRLGMDTIQVFTKNQRYWRERVVSPHEGKDFRDACVKYGVKQAFSHAIYLISLASENEETVEKSVQSLIMELERCRVLGLTHTVLHPGVAGSLPVSKALRKISGNIKKALAATKGSPVKILIENTAGQGTSVGGKIENIAELIYTLNSKRVGLCLDTCHAFASGYDIRSKKNIERFITLIDNEIGLNRLLCFHLNDSKAGLGSRVDRHAHIGQGLLGVEPFEFIMQHFDHLPKVIETSKENDADRKNLTLLRQLAIK